MSPPEEAEPAAARDPGLRHALRHALATLAYRAARPLRDAPATFPFLEVGNGVRTPLKIVAHMADLMAFAKATLEDRRPARGGGPAAWEDEVGRFFSGLEALDGALAGGAGGGETLERLLQGPVSDALTHVGQLALLRRVAGSPIRGESYHRAAIEVGRVERDQPPPPER